jgi:hypothetical protein
MEWALLVSRMGEMRNIWNILVVKIEGKDHLDVDVKKRLKLIIEALDLMTWF